MISKDELQRTLDAYKQHGPGGWRHIGMAERTFRERISNARAAGLFIDTRIVVESPSESSAIVGRTIDEFVKAHDNDFIVPEKIKEALAKLGSNWLYEEEFRRLTEIPAATFSRYKNRFESHVVVIKGAHPKRIWVGTVDQAAALRKRVTS